ncbi:universal stress protein [Primorskyibacter sp. S187A]|uniref:universal stress protein n=1 Tax=Primorskyibacter sp. S187A TaxID=3415130 RepID=UPI003C7A5D18
MTPKTVFTALTEAEQAKEHLIAAATLAGQYGAHLDVLALGVDRTQVGYYYAGATALVVQEALTRAQTGSKSAGEAVRAELTGQPALRWSVDNAACQLADVGRIIARNALFSDLVVLPQPYGPEKGEELENVLEGALFGGMGRVLVLPDGAAAPKLSRITLAWNNSPEAFAAARAALPYLVQADLVKVLIVDPPTHGRDRSDPGGALSEFLARHKVKVEIDVQAKSLPRVSDMILRHASDSNADMIVMGAYGHSRFREAIIGGATRHMLELADRPLFMAHA